MTSRGRPLSFDRETALRVALKLFQTYGYEGTSISDLTTSMGISAPSLYNAFGSKERLFKESVEYYVAHDGGTTARALREQPTAREAIEAMLSAALEPAYGGGEGRACLVVLGAANCAEDHKNIDDYLKTYRQANVEAIVQRLRKGQEQGELPAGTDLQSLASFYATVLNGLAIQIRDGVSREVLDGVVGAAMRAWPAI